MGLRARVALGAGMVAVVWGGLLGVPVPAQAQLPWDREAWTVAAAAHAVERYQGREALMLEGGTAWLQGVELRDGVIEFDLAASGEQGFHGVLFRAADHRNHEHVYLRPHLSGKPDATQYNPVFQGVSAWQLYTGPAYGRQVEIPVERWVRIRVAILDGRMEMTVDGGEPLVFPHLVREPAAGALGLSSSGAPARFANVVVRPGAEEAGRVMGRGEGTGPDEDAATARAGVRTVDRWRVSRPFAEERVDGRVSLEDADRPGSWTTVGTDVRGMVNLARWAERSPEENTVFAALTLSSEGARTVPVTLAFSDRVRVFLNGRQLFAAADEWRSRDYRFLGSAGWFDTVFLPLEPGENELLVAVSEDFGGWGVGMRLPTDVRARP